MNTNLLIANNYINIIKTEKEFYDVSIFIPIFNSEKSLEELIFRLENVMKQTSKSYEYVLLDDGSKDDSWQVICNLNLKYSNLCAIRHLKNQGYNRALQHGLEFCRGEWVITIDDDLQHPPEEIKKFIEVMKLDNVDVVFGSYKKRSHRNWKNIGSNFYLFLIRRIFKIPRNLDITSFRMIHRRVVNQLKNTVIAEPQAGFMILKSSNRIINIEVEHHKRKYGKSGIKISTMIRLTIDLIIHHTTLPLRLITGIGFSCFSFSIILSFFYIAKYFIHSISLNGFTTLVLLILNFGGLTLFTIGILGYYMSRVLKELTHSKYFSLENFLPPRATK